MKKFMVLHYGFEPPSDDEMAKWNEWFGSIVDRKVEQGHLPVGREFGPSGATDLPFGKDSITGFTIFKAEDFEEAAAIAEKCPFVLSTRVYEIKNG